MLPYRTHAFGAFPLGPLASLPWPSSSSSEASASCSGVVLCPLRGTFPLTEAPLIPLPRTASKGVNPNCFFSKINFMLIDDVTIKVKAGNGGDGRAAFNKNMMSLGPVGGDGGRGGDVYCEGVSDLNALIQFRNKKE